MPRISSRVCLFVAKRTEHRTGHGLPVLLFNATHLHAQVPRLDNHSDALRAIFSSNRPRDLAGHALLNLQSPREASPAAFFGKAHVHSAEQKR